MPTVQTDVRIPTILPDIFRTPDGVNLDVGPFDRLRDGSVLPEHVKSEKGASQNGRNKNLLVQNSGACPRIVLRDALGRELDTFTTLQEAIYRAKWNVKQTGLAREPLEWRLPKAPPPARPDLTRTCPPPKHPVATEPGFGGHRDRWHHSRVLVSKNTMI